MPRALQDSLLECLAAAGIWLKRFLVSMKRGRSRVRERKELVNLDCLTLRRAIGNSYTI